MVPDKSIDRLMDTEQFAAMIGVRPATVRQWVWRRQVEFVRIGRSIRFKPATAERLIEVGTVPVLDEQGAGRAVAQ